MPSEQELLHTRPQQTKLWLSIYQPTTVFSARVNDAGITRGAYQITYDNGSGTLGDVHAGMTLLIGSSVGARDKGKLRVRSITPTVITVAENADVSWADDDYLTIINYYELWPVYPRIIQDPGDPLDTIWYKDYDVVYTDQNSVLGSFLCMGSHYAGFVDDATGVAQVYYSASGTFNVKGDALTYDWNFGGATTTGTSAQTPGYIEYDTPGHYTTTLAVTNASGGVDYSYRHVSIYERPTSGSQQVPIKKWTLDGLSGSRDGGGWSCRVQVWDDFSSVEAGALVVIFADDWYGNVKQSIGGNAPNRSSIVFAGYIADGTIQHDWATSSVNFQVVSPTLLAKDMEGFSISVESSSDPAGWAATDENYPSGWTLVLNMDVRRALYHYLRWHTTFPLIADFVFENFTDQNIQFFDADRSSIYEALSGFLRSTLVAEVVCDRQGAVYIENHIKSIDDAANTVLATPYLSNLSSIDWMGQLNIDDKLRKEVSFLELGGIYFPGPGSDSTAYIASSPGLTPGYQGNVQRQQGLAVASQSQLNTLVGNVYAYANSRYPRVESYFSGNYRHVDIAPQRLLNLSVQADDNNRGIVWTNKAFHITRLDYGYDANQQFIRQGFELHEVTQGIDGETIAVPVVPVDGYGNTTTIPKIGSIGTGITPFTSVKVYRGSVTYQYSDSNPQIFQFNTVHWNYGGFQADLGANARIVVPVTGYYLIQLDIPTITFGYAGAEAMILFNAKFAINHYQTNGSLRPLDGRYATNLQDVSFTPANKTSAPGAGTRYFLPVGLSLSYMAEIQRGEYIQAQAGNTGGVFLINTIGDVVGNPGGAGSMTISNVMFSVTLLHAI